jgi:ribokinase
MKLLNFGSLNYDYVYSVDHIVQPGETLSAGGMETFCGGKGLNQSIALAKAGAQVYHAGIVGTDGDVLLKMCDDNYIDRPYKTRG